MYHYRTMLRIINFILILWSSHMILGEVEVNTGAYFQNLPYAVSYEAALPLIYEIPLIDENTTRAMEKCFKQACNNNRECMTIGNRLGAIINGIGEYSPTDTNILANDGDSVGWDFHIASRNHVKRLFTTNEEIQLFKKRLKNFPYKIEINKLKIVKDNSYDQCVPTYIYVLSQIVTEISIKTASLISACHARHLSPEIIKIEVMDLALKSFAKEIDKKGYKLAILNAGEYYGLPLSDCIFTKDTAIVGIHIPVIRKDIGKIELKRLVPTPLAWEGKTCYLGTDSIDIAIVSRIGEQNIEIFSPRCDPHRDRLCVLSKTYDHNAITSACTKFLLMGGTVDDLAQFCPITCQSNIQKATLVTPLSQDTFLLTHVKHKLILHYNDKKNYLNFEEGYGALWVQLPCNYTIQFEDNSTLKPSFPCLNTTITFKMKQVIPAAWANLKTQILPPYDSNKYPTFNNLNECLNKSAVKAQNNWLDKLLLTSPWIAIICIVIFLIYMHVNCYCNRDTYADLVAQRIFRRPPATMSRSNDHEMVPTQMDFSDNPMNMIRPRLPSRPIETDYVIPTN